MANLFIIILHYFTLFYIFFSKTEVFSRILSPLFMVKAQPTENFAGQ